MSQSISMSGTLASLLAFLFDRKTAVTEEGEKSIPETKEVFPPQPQLSIQAYVEITVRKKMEGRFGDGIIFLTSRHPKTGEDKVVSHRVACNFVDAALKDTRKLISKQADDVKMKMAVEGQINWIKVFKTSPNLVINVDKYEVAQDSVKAV